MKPTRYVRLRIDCTIEYEHDNISVPGMNGDDLLDALRSALVKMNRKKPKLQPKAVQILPGATFEVRLRTPPKGK